MAPILADATQKLTLLCYTIVNIQIVLPFLLRATCLNGNPLLVAKHKSTKYAIRICFANKNLFNTCASYKALFKRFEVLVLDKATAFIYIKFPWKGHGIRLKTTPSLINI